MRYTLTAILAGTTTPATFRSSGFFREMVFVLFGCLLVCLAGQAIAERPPIVVPASTDTIVERLPAGYGSLAPRRPGMTSAQVITEAEALLVAAARTGDSRLAARADGLLAQFPVQSKQSVVLRVRAFSAQHRHDFAGASRLLDRLVELDPRDGDARMSRAQVRLVQGQLDLARADCAVLVLGVDSDDGMLCAASISLRRSEFTSAAGLLDLWFTQADKSNPRQGYATLIRAEIASRALDSDADRWFRQALAPDPADVKVLAAYARWLRSVHRDRDVETLLANTDVDGLQLQRALAARSAGAANAARLADAQQRRYDTAHAVGSQPELRDEAEFLLTLRSQPVAALALAKRNFEAQRDVEDVDILVRAANAAGRPEALDSLRAWAKSQDIMVPGLRVSTR